jgi:hypothetical protein
MCECTTDKADPEWIVCPIFGSLKNSSSSLAEVVLEISHLELSIVLDCKYLFFQILSLCTFACKFFKRYDILGKLTLGRKL